MAANLHNLLPTLLFLSLLLHFPVRSTSQECPYPCYPPPTGSGNNPAPVSTTPPSPRAGGSFSPPVSITPPTGYLPNYIPPPVSVNGLTPPPPDPILPWFPFYYRKPPHADQSSSTALQGSSRRAMITTIPLVFIFFSFFH